MGNRTTIEWTEATWNPVRGCSIVSEGCRNCYAMRMAHRSNRPGGAYEGLTRIGAHGPTWTGDVRFVSDLLDYPLRLRKPHRIFVNSMSDLFHESIPDEWINLIFSRMGACDDAGRGHVFQVLTKRPLRMADYMRTRAREAWNGPRMNRSSFPPRNVWLGVSVEDQKTADERIPLLIETPAAVRWISAEPLLGPIDLQVPWSTLNAEYPANGIHWVVAGGESGPGARPMHPDWVRSLRDQCQAANVPFFFKQWGSWAPHESETITAAQASHSRTLLAAREKCGYYCSEDVGHVDHKEVALYRVGKKAAGNLLDGRQHLEYPA